MVHNILEPKKIRELLDIKAPFYVESYQRGYRWGVFEVEALLNDINDFAKQKTDNDYYWLQPIVVKEVTDENNITRYELIDGQQRLTTIFLILSFLGEDKNLSIDYNTRTSSKAFFAKLNEVKQHNSWEEFIKNNSEDNKIDNFHIFQACQTIKKWWANHQNNHFKQALIENTKIIWYEIKDSSEPKAIFERINVGKIPLTNAELVKALYLNSKSQLEEKDLLRAEIAEKWDKIEYALQNDRFWYFINPPQTKIANRIECVLDLVSQKSHKVDHREERLHTFIYFSQRDLIETWKQVETTYQTLLEWFETPELYHYIGYLITTGFAKIDDLMKKYHEGVQAQKTKSDFIQEIKSLVKEKLKNYKIEDLSYEKSYNEIKNILLLFNIQTVLDTTPYNFFPFDKYKTSKWSLEHIHAQNSQPLKKPEEIKKWINETIPILEKFVNDNSKERDAKLLIEELNKILLQDNPELLDVSNKVFDFFGDRKVAVHNISNLALLDSITNSSLNNSIFSVKRTKILEAEMDKDKEKNVFIPICTKYAFLKYYSADISQMYFWGETDQNDYQKAIQKCLEDFIS
jgi:uncharacterized protein with ParB-like and HNH nuclease domain